MCHDDCPHPVSGGDAISELETSIQVTDREMPAFVALPDQRPAPSVLIIHDINGANAFYHDVARRLALAGYIAVLPDFFHRQGALTDDSRESKQARMRSMSQSVTISDIESALIWTRHLGDGNGKVGTLGFCMGGTLVLLAASRDPLPDATVAFYGFPFRERTPTAPILPGDEGEVATLRSPLLAFWGTEDAGVGMDNVDRYESLLDQYDRDYEFVRYEGVGHGFLTFDEQSPAWPAAHDAWDHTLEFFGEHLAAGTS
jgi:carboxymethylenebutenolidase